MSKKIFAAAVFAHIAGAVFFLAAVAYLGTFTRYMADDYCESYTTQTYSPLTAVVNRYQEGSWRAANRYSNLLFVGVMEALLGWGNIETVPAGLIFLWAAGLILLSRQARKFAGLEWNFSVDVFLGLTLAFLPILEAPNRYQTFYWRSSMATHFVPLVFLNVLAAFLLYRARAAKPAAFWSAVLLAPAAFLIGGFSEPPVTVMVVGAALGLASLSFASEKTRRAFFLPLAGIFFGAVAALLTMAVSPAARNLGKTAPSFFEWAGRTAEYTYLFLLDIIKSLPLPLLFSVACPAIFIFLFSATTGKTLPINARAASRLALMTPPLLVLFIAAGFSTSAYGQSYPVARARFFAHHLTTIVLVVEGVLFGNWLAARRAVSSFVRIPAWIGGIVLFALAFYPARAGLQILQQAPQYRERAALWDERNAHIYKLREQGQTDLVVPQFDGVDGVKELDSYETHWVNVCAAKYYGVNSIRAIPIYEEELEEYYGN
ncbi:MAG: DUF6056 family protein [Chloroflexi bacterium]|nr:DUF6056 family protein [Chloroflexota bacterium]